MRSYIAVMKIRDDLLVSAVVWGDWSHLTATLTVQVLANCSHSVVADLCL